MITSILKEQLNSTVEIEINIPWDDIKDSYDTIFQKVASEMELSGFRKGKAPKSLIDKNINKNKIYEEVIKDIIPKAYAQAINKHNLKPITHPKIELVKAKDKENWVVKVTIALVPKVNLKEYKQKVKDLLKSKVKIWTPGTADKTKENTKVNIDELIKVILSEVEINISELLIEQETNRLLSDIIDQTKKLGLTIEQYIMAKGKTIETLKEEYNNQAINNLKIEFILNEIANQENITVEQKDIENIISKIEKEEDKEKMRKDSYYLAHLVRQQKTLDFLSNL